MRAAGAWSGLSGSVPLLGEAGEVPSRGPRCAVVYSAPLWDWDWVDGWLMGWV